MDIHRFDDLTKALAGPRSRRGLLRVLFGGSVAAVGLAAVGTVEQVAAAKEEKQAKKQADYCSTESAKLGERQAEIDAMQAELNADRVALEAECSCLAIGDACTDASQCCTGGEDVACGPVDNLGQDECCRPLGGSCPTPGEYEGCCSFVFPGGSGTSIMCSPDGICGGPGAHCGSDVECASGVCCGVVIDATCCAAGQQCVDFVCMSS